MGDFNLPVVALSLLLAFFIGSLVKGVLYNLYLHPLADIPGPKLAAASFLYQTFFSLSGGKSRYYIKVAELHEQYGPVVRITPHEVHLSDPAHYDVMYSVGSKYAKSMAYYGALGAGYSTFVSSTAEVHKPRRAKLDPFFSRRMVLSLEHLVQSRAEKLCQIITSRFSKSQAVDLYHAFRSISVDVISDYAFGESYELLARDDLGKEFFDDLAGLGPTWWVFQQLPAVQKFALSLPIPIAKAMSKPLKQLLECAERAKAQVLVIKAKMDAGEKVEKPCIFESLLSPDEGYVIPSPDQIKDEAYAILNAASDTTGNAMTVAAYNVVTNPEIYRALTAELKEAFPNPGEKLDFMKLEKLPYLTGVIKEGLRLSFGVPGRLPRVVPYPGATFNGYFLPPGKFDPTRWLDPKETRRIEKVFVPFSKGSRACAGINLAYCELYLTLGTLFRRFENLTANHLTGEDLAYNDYFSAQTPLTATKFHVTERKE
ncbi:Cytochrome P450 monooxygenase yanH [Hyphodiscus hymeniophilus]|uniref:Cytochrome P450 monooxygenase yanH n=1 Tax=Hyphodiscus hymeniophilus TaxID=353542 RepID=A0A9P6VHV9_9HELO|nr:Cytochrome P450 monooxygenase yanH [Hyphodiscus hymeniophilus]